MEKKTFNVNENSKLIKEQFELITKTIVDNRNHDDFYHVLRFNTNELFDHDEYTKHPNSYEEGGLTGMFASLNEVSKNDCLYWFELESIEKAKELNDLLDVYRKSGDKKVPAKNKNEESNVLYVGVRRRGSAKKTGLTNIVGRINQHLGYYHVKSTQGLQLYEYARGKDFDITIKVVEFADLDSAYLNVIEKLVADELQPLCGRH